MNAKELMLGNYFEVLTKHINIVTAMTETEVQLYSESEKIHPTKMFFTKLSTCTKLN